MKLIPIDRDKYDEYRLSLMFDCYKWDPQFEDNNTVARYALVLTEAEHEEISRLTEELDRETRLAENFLNENQHLIKPLALPRSVRKEIENMKNYEPGRNVRLMRYDFHPTKEGKWAVSEVNSDVPGGFAEASLMPQKAMEFIRYKSLTYINYGDILVAALKSKLPKKDNAHDIKIALIHCTCYSDDRQVMQFLGDRLKREGYSVIYAASDHLNFKEKKAVCILDGNCTEVDAIIRFTPLEWLTEVKPKRWSGYFDTETLSLNHPVAMFAQTKRFPLVWDVLEENGISMKYWRELLPETVEVTGKMLQELGKHESTLAAQKQSGYGKDRQEISRTRTGSDDVRDMAGFIFKPACGRVGEKISIKEACVGNEYKKILKDVKRHPKRYLAQRRFASRPLEGENGDSFHVCIGSYAVEERHAGYYARISRLPRIDSNAADIPVLIEKSGAEQPAGVVNQPSEVANRPAVQGLNHSTCRTDFESSPRDAYMTWAPTGKKWVDWVRPVPFLLANEYVKGYAIPEISPDIVRKGIEASDPYIRMKDKCNMAIMVDLPGAESVEAGLRLAASGYRPIPVYNGTQEQEGARALVDNQSVGLALIQGAEILQEIEIADDAPPAFLMDKNRLNRRRVSPGVFDNSYDMYHQDLPTAGYFLKNGIDKILIISDSLSIDLRIIFYEFQKKGISFYLAKEYGRAKKIRIRKTFIKERD